MFDKKKLQNAAKKTMKYHEEDGMDFSDALSVAINQVFGSSLNFSISKRIRTAVSCELNEYKKCKPETQPQKVQKKVEPKKQTTVIKTISLSSNMVNNIAARALEYHARVRYVGSIDEHLGRAIHEFKPDLSQSETRILLQDIKLVLGTDKKKNYRRNSGTKRLKARENSSPPRPQQLSWNLNRETNSIEYY